MSSNDDVEQAIQYWRDRENSESEILQDADWTERDPREPQETDPELCPTCGSEGIMLSESAAITGREFYGAENPIWYSSYASRWMCERCQGI